MAIQKRMEDFYFEIESPDGKKETFSAQGEGQGSNREEKTEKKVRRGE